MVEPLMGKKSLPRTAACKTLWRNIAIAWDGRVVPCCIDMEETLLLGNLQHMSIKEIINGTEARKIRRKHLQGNYPDVCKYCDPHFG
jgi:radical SAM protein with 4Fe4S-binding SPASM domain